MKFKRIGESALLGSIGLTALLLAGCAVMPQTAPSDEILIDRPDLTESAAALEAGCSTQWSPLRVAGPDELNDIPGLELSEPLQPDDNGSEEFATVPFGLPPVDKLDGMRLCLYAADSTTEFFVGTFTSGSILSADDGRTILAAADYQVMPLIACIRPATAFVVAHPLVDGQDAGGTITIELDGCQRLFGTTGFTLVSDDILALVQPQ